MTIPPESGRGATVVITHRVRAGSDAAYEAWLNEIGPVCRGIHVPSVAADGAMTDGQNSPA